MSALFRTYSDENKLFLKVTFSCWVDTRTISRGSVESTLLRGITVNLFPTSFVIIIIIIIIIIIFIIIIINIIIIIINNIYY